MPKKRPWENEKSEFFRTRDYGPDVAADGTSRDDFHNEMEKMGWNYSNDESILTVLYKISAASLEKDPSKPDFLKDLMKKPVKTYEDRLEVLKGFKEISHYINDSSQVAMDKRLDEEINRMVFFQSMKEEGWNKEGDRETLEILYSIPERYVDKVTTKTNRDEMLSIGGNSFWARRRALDYIKDGDRNEYLTNEQQEALKEIEKRVEEGINQEKAEQALKANSVLRKYFKHIVELGLDKVNPIYASTPRRTWGPYEEFIDLELDPKIAEGLKADIDKLPIDQELLNKEPNEVEEKLRDALNNMIKKNCSGYLEDLENMESFENIASHYSVFQQGMTVEEYKEKLFEQVKQSIEEKKRSEELEKDRKNNPQKYERFEKAEVAVQKVNTLLQKLKKPENAAFLEALQKGEPTDHIPVENPNVYSNYNNNWEQDNAAQQQEMMDILDEVAGMKLTEMSKMRTDNTLQNAFWDNYSKPLTEKQIREMQDKFTELTDSGMNWDEYIDSGAYQNFLKDNKIQASKEYDPFLMAEKTIQGRESVEEFRRTCSQANYNQAMKCLDLIGKEYAKKKEHVADLNNAQDLTGWFFKSGYNLMDNSLLVTNGFDEKEIDGQKYKMIKLGEGIQEDKIDRDKLDLTAYNKMIDKAKEAQQLYKENEEVFRNVFETMDSSKNGIAYVLGESNKQVKAMSNNKELMAKLNRFRHLLYEMKTADQDVCKLIDMRTKKPMMVDPLSADTKFDKDMMKKEMGILDNCVEMLKEPSQRVHRNSKEYTKIMDSIKKIKDDMKTAPNEEEARKTYIKNVKKVLNDINRYRVHKAKDGVKNDATHDKLMAAERVDKLLRTRFKNLEEKEYEDTLEGVGDLYKVEVDKNLSGDDYVLAKALGKVDNMKKYMMDIAKEIKQEDVGKKRSNSIGGINNEKTVKELGTVNKNEKTGTKKEVNTSVERHSRP